MKKTVYAVLGTILFLSSATLAFAAVDPNGPAFAFTCDPYSTNFIEAQAYIPTNGGNCTYTVPLLPAIVKEMEVYKGTIGNAVLVNTRLAIFDDSQTFTSSGNEFGNFSPQPGDAFFAVAYTDSDGSNIGPYETYLSTGVGSAPPDLLSMTWHWGAPATVTADPVTSNVGSVPATFTATISGFVDGETLGTSGITGAASCTTTATNASPVGDYPITCERGTLSSTKYAFDTFVAGTLHLVTPPPPAPTCSLTASPTSIVQGNSSTLTFSSTNATAGTIDNGVGAVAASGTKSVSPSSTTNYTDTVTGAGGTATCSASVTVTPPVVTDHQAPVITITNPIKNGVYAKTDSVFLTATVTDASALATTTYWFGTKKINPAQPLPLSTVSTPSIQNVSVSATDVYGNTSTTTLKFFVVKNTNSCLLDIIQVLVLITQDKTLPDKPTIQNLISDCSALLKGHHRYDDGGHW